jgi:hypothetical protein
MIEVIGIGLVVSLVWLLIYGMSATDAEALSRETDRTKASASETRHAA